MDLTPRDLPSDERATPLYSEEDLARIDPAARLTPRPEDLTGTRAGSYELVRVLGTGGLSSVWLGEHPVIGSRVAVKVLHAAISECEEAVRRFVVEAQAVNRIESPHVVRVFDFGKLADGRDYAVMELLEGETLGDRLAREQRLDWRVLRPIAIQIARALLAAHRAGILHRDLKPDNVFLCGPRDRPSVKVLDFGIAKLLDADERPSARRRTGPGVAIGTPLYAAPEQAAGDALGPEADIYSLGVVLYEALAGRPPFLGTVAQVLSAKVRELPPPLARLAPGLSATVARLVDSMVAPTPLERPASMAIVLDRLEEGVFEELAYAATPADGFVLELDPGAPTMIVPAPGPVSDPRDGCTADAPEPCAEERVYLPGVATGFGEGRARPAPERRRATRIVVVAAAAVIVIAAAAVAVALVLAARDGEAYRGSAPPSVVTAVPPEPTPASQPIASPLVEARAAPTAPAAARPEAPRRSARTVLLESEPPGATVKLRGRAIGQTPLTLRVDTRLRSLTLVVEKPGYRSLSRTVAALDRRLKVELTPEAWVDPFRQ
jgi:serine/threonine-protein kinase